MPDEQIARTAQEYKPFVELDLNVLMKGIAGLISEQIGGDVEVSLQKFERLSAGTHNEHILLTVDLKDENWSSRLVSRMSKEDLVGF